MTVDEALEYVLTAPSRTEREQVFADEVYRLREERDRWVARMQLLEWRLEIVGGALTYSSRAS